jgi:cytosine/adenosine deaminase-related metal-dependent hydrolase
VSDASLVTQGAKIVGVDRESSPADTIDLGDAVIVPGLVNAHTHLEFSCLPAPLGAPGVPLPKWLATIVAWRRQQDADHQKAARWRAEGIRQGLAESLRCGVTTLGDIATQPFASEPYRDGLLDVVAFLEFIGLDPQRIELLAHVAHDYLAREHLFHSPLGAGLSPHAPYSVRTELVARLCRACGAARAPLAMHLAESREECELVARGRGPFVEFLETLQVWDASAFERGLRVLDYLHWLSQADRALVIHGNYLEPDEIGFLAEHRRRMSVVYCPRTHDFFGHSPYPLGAMLDAGVRVALGTDSRASNPDLDLLAEMRFVANRSEQLAPQAVLRLATLSAAEALGLDRRVGSLEAGKQADFVVLRPRGGTVREALAAVHDASYRVERVYKSGVLVFKDDSC